MALKHGWGTKMHEIVHINNTDVVFEVVSGNVFANSLQIADVFEKNHKEVMRAMRNQPDDEFARRNFAQSSYINQQNKQQPMYQMTRDGFSLIVMGFTGQKAREWKIQFIKAFNLMEEKLRSGASAALPDMTEMNRRMLDIQARVHHLYEDRETLREQLSKNDSRLQRSDILMNRMAEKLGDMPMGFGDMKYVREMIQKHGRKLADRYGVGMETTVPAIYIAIRKRFAVESYHEVPHSSFFELLGFIETITL